MKQSNKFDMLIMCIYAILIVLSYILTVLFFKNFGFITVIVAIALLYLDKFVLPRRKEIISKESIKKRNEEIFLILGELSRICVERVVDKHYREINRDKEIFALFSKLKAYKDKLIDVNIIFTSSTKKNNIWSIILIEKKLNISANIDNTNARVWYANIYLNGKHNQHPNREQLISEVYPVLESFRQKNKMKWNIEIQKYFISK